MTDYRCVNGHDKCGEMYAGPECPYCERTDDTSAAVERLKSLTIDWDGSRMVDGEPPRDGITCGDCRAVVAHIEALREKAERLEKMYIAAFHGRQEMRKGLRAWRDMANRYGLALMMIREGTADPKKVAADALDRARIDAALEGSHD